MRKTKPARSSDQADNPTAAEDRIAAEETTATAVAENPVERAEDDFGTPDQESLPADSGLTARDVVIPGRMLLPDQIESLLGIPAEQIRRAIRAGELPRRGADAVVGITLLGWIDEQKIPHRVTQEAVAEHRRENAVSPPPKPPRGIVAAATAKVAEWYREQRDGVEAELHQYVAILRRADRPEDDDGILLANLVEALGLTAEQVDEDQRTIKKALDLEALHDSREGAGKKAADVGRAYRDWLVAKEKEERARHVEMRSLATRAQRCGMAVGQLFTLSRQRPELFTAGDPPRVKRPRSST